MASEQLLALDPHGLKLSPAHYIYANIIHGNDDHDDDDDELGVYTM